MCKRYVASMNAVFNNFPQITRWKLYNLMLNALLQNFANISKVKAAQKKQQHCIIKKNDLEIFKFDFQKTSREITSKPVHPHCLVNIYS